MVSTLHSRAFCGAGFYLAKRVFPGFGSCNGHVTAITSEAELNVKGNFLLLFCCYCSTLQHCSALKVVHGELLYRILVVWKVLCQGVIFDGLVEWDSILLHVVEEWSGSNAAIDGFVRFDLGGYNIAVTAISIRSRKKVGSVEGIGGAGSGRASELALRSLDSG